ncbi:MAG: hypothetical protein H6710_15340 [Myxococcales bacterium]|nr:hypothetical protein [Myxococcales bacterium]
MTRDDRIGELQALLERERLGLLDALARQAEALARLGEADAAKIAEICALEHEVRASLTPVLGHAELLERCGAPLSASERDDLAAIRRLGDELLGDLRRLLDVAMIEAGDLHLSLAPTDVDALVDHAIAALAPAADAHGLTLVRRRGDALPRIRADGERLRQAIDALLANAIEFSERGTITITTRIDDDARRVAIEVRDPGIGIAGDDLEVIFEAYRHRDRQRGRQRGVGLALARAIADGHGGALQVASVPGKGSIFTLTLPFEPTRRRTEGDLGELTRSHGRQRRRHTPSGRAA